MARKKVNVGESFSPLLAFINVVMIEFWPSFLLFLCDQSPQRFFPFRKRFAMNCHQIEFFPELPKPNGSDLMSDIKRTFAVRSIIYFPYHNT